MPLPPAWRPQTEPVISCGENNVNDDEAPGYDEHQPPRITEEPDSPGSPVESRLKKAKSTDKVRVAGWDKMDEAERKDYQEAWLRKGAREKERSQQVNRGEGSSAGPSGGYDDEETPEFEDEDPELYLAGPSGSGTQDTPQDPPKDS